MDDRVTLALAMAALGQIGLCTTLLLMRSPQRPVYLPLAAFFIAAGIVCLGPAVFAFLPVLATYYFAITIPAYLLLGPALWLYVDGLTSETAWRPQARHGWHVLPVGLGLLATVLVGTLSHETRHEIFVNGELVAGLYPALVVLYIFALVLAWTVQSGYYVVRILYRLASYRRRLKSLFASTDHSELGWLSGLVVVIGAIWLVSFASVISDNFAGGSIAGPRSGALMGLVLVWLLAVWGLRQKPGFEGRYLDEEPAQDVPPDPGKRADAKYVRSALGPEQAERIVTKIETAMKRDQIYLDPTISLHKLARHVGAPPNHISQTLNETIGACFFDYVNKWRIDAAKPKIAAGQETILDVAMSVGFNARSSFYKAFKRETGQTPSEYRNAYIAT